MRIQVPSLGPASASGAKKDELLLEFVFLV